MVSYVIVLVYVLYMLYKSYRANLAKKQVGTVALVGYSDYQRIFISLLNLFFLPFIVTLDGNGKYGVLFLLILLSALLDRTYLGDNGIKVNDIYISKEDILYYYMVEGKINQFEIFVKGKLDPVSITVNKRNLGKPLVEILADWKSIG
ncbi:hypothetical protein [Paenibacillus oryzisoli]|uniref:DUF5673 domain-containing protein n=1 Tax=Paenibacillus oryzisoli TaxID=1850517 RepID=A0A198AGX7_9BACL|nr:hypothetical protein [Paenibacillus oryzisoli]OAS20291.1 hypothetical protein A8708_25680 [Paenibacillus oryzisoli]